MWVPGFIHDVHDLNTLLDIYTFAGNIIAVIIVVHVCQIVPIVLFIIVRGVFYKQRDDFALELLRVHAAERTTRILDFSCDKIRDLAFQTEEVIDYAYRRLAEVETGIQRSMVVEALAIRRQLDSKTLDGIFLGAPWYQVALGLFQWRLIFSCSNEKFGLRELRAMVCEIRTGKMKLEKSDLES